MRGTTLTTLLRIDAVANEVGGIALAAAGGLLAEPLGLTATWPLWLAAALLVVNGLQNWLVARHPTRTGLSALAAVDVVFAVAVLALATGNPTGAESWVRWILAVVADAVLVVGIAKVVGLRSLPGASSPVEV